MGSLFDAGLVDKVVAFVGPLIIGGKEARTAVAGLGVDKMMDATKLEHINYEKFGDDLMVIGYVKKE